ncbi:aladin [Tribolium castaneum]|uniref:Aladin-like Protein n=1 Tax=Tribolium castaneum TaxID=7070 RepID=D6WNN3_TRICA|nr:PREDICTED: aladin [Tribolium castaneum]EFA03757.2 Aladin-like Protein [Tribolium castaneum]|eukprot:XP_969843.1 PREDICTED: aladin [Tribolium castaneum]
MRNLEDFPVPIDGEVTLCEINGRMQCMNHEFANVSTFTTAVDKHPKVHITRDLLHLPNLGDEGRALFLPTDVPFLKQLTQVYAEQGLKEVLHTATLHQHLLISQSARFLLAVWRYLRKARLILNPSLEYHSCELIDELSQTRNWANNTIKCIAWHLHNSRLAVATCDDSVRIYCNDSSFVPLLRCKQQRNVTCLAWRPMSLTEIAVGHENGIIIWHVDFNSLVTRPSVSNSIMLQRVDHKPVMSLAWSPRGNLLVSAAALDSNILVWDVELNKTSVLKGSRDSGNILLKWSPAKDKLLSVSNGIVFRIWDCQHWENERWTVPSGRVQAACWTSCGTSLLFATSTEPVIYGLNMKSDHVFSSNSESSIDHAVPLFDLSKIDLEGIAVGGIVQSMEADPKGNHLAVFFKDTSCVALFSVIKSPLLQLIPSSLIVGLAAEVPSTIAFQYNFKPGACLSIAWSSGHLQHFPIIYTDLTNDFNASQYVQSQIRSLNNSR